MKQTLHTVLLVGLTASVLLFSVDAQAQRGRSRRPRAEVVAWTANAALVVFAERQTRSRRIDLVARRVPSGDVVARVRVFPGPCGRVINRQPAIAHACALSELRPRLPSRYRDRRYHIAANERGRIVTFTLRADGSIVEHQLPSIGLVLRGRTERERDDRAFAVLEVARLDREGDESRVLDRRRVRPRSRRRWTLLQAGENHYIVVGRGLLRRIGRRRPPRGERRGPSSDVARGRPANG